MRLALDEGPSMNDYPLKVYVAASWQSDSAVLDKLVVAHLIRQGITVVQDHPENKTAPPITPWFHRVDLYMRDCSGLVAIFPFRNTGPQTTTPYIFPEILSAARRGLPILLFHHREVQLTLTHGPDVVEASFGSGSGEVLNADQLFGDQTPNVDKVDELISNACRLVLPQNIIFSSQPIPALQEKQTERLIEDFVTHIKARGEVDGPYVMNILAFVDRESVHPVIAGAVFKATGLKCRVSLDTQGKNNEQRNEWKRALRGAEFYVAELSRLRDNCVYEVGLGHGAEKPVLIVCRRALDTLPFGLDNEKLLRPYKSRSDLGREVERGCQLLYRRKVYNLDPELQREFSGRTPGIPPWLEANVNGDLGWLLTASIAGISLAVALLLLSGFLFFLIPRT